MLDISFNLKEESEAVISAVVRALKSGMRTADIADSKTDKRKY